MLTRHFFDSMRASAIYGGTLSVEAVNGMNAVSIGFDASKQPDKCSDDLAVIMATVVIETGRDFNLSVEEGRSRIGKPYNKPAGPYGYVYYGRGPCQVTWLANYERAKLRTGIDFVKHPEYMCDPKYGVVYMIDGMFNGLFTKYRLRNFVKPGVKTSIPNFYNSRRIINGLDRAQEHARYCAMFQLALSEGGYMPATAYVAERQPIEAAKAAVPAAPVAKPADTEPAVKTTDADPPSAAGEDRPSMFGGLRNWFGG